MSTLPDPEGRKLLRVEVRNAQTPIENKPEWIRTTARAGENYQDMRSLSHAKGLHTVCNLHAKVRFLRYCNWASH